MGRKTECPHKLCGACLSETVELERGRSEGKERRAGARSWSVAGARGRKRGVGARSEERAVLNRSVCPRKTNEKRHAKGGKQGDAGEKSEGTLNKAASRQAEGALTGAPPRSEGHQHAAR